MQSDLPGVKSTCKRRSFCRLAPLLLCLLPACQQKMALQPSLRPDRPSAFFADGLAARPPVHGTVARGSLRLDQHLFGEPDTGERRAGQQGLATALVGAGSGSPLNAAAILAAGIGAKVLGDEYSAIDTFPFPITPDVLKHGQNRFMIYCVVCHDALGTGQGKIVERGYTRPPSYHIERLRRAPVGHFFDVMSRGYGSMPSYGSQVPPLDRWAIAAYIRALQASQRFPINQLPADLRAEWQERGRKDGGRPE